MVVKVDGKVSFIPYTEDIQWSSSLGSATEVGFDHAQFERLMEEYKVEYAKYLDLLKKYEADNAQYQIDKQAYDRDFDLYIKSLPLARQWLARQIVELRYHILTASQDRDANIRRVKKLEREMFKQAVIDRIVGTR